MERDNLRAASHPSYSPNLAPSGFFLFDSIERVLHGAKFQSPEELLDGMLRIV
jgi:hypothetical protein